MQCAGCLTPLAPATKFCPHCGRPTAAGDTSPTDPQRVALERAVATQYEIVRLLGRGGMGAVYLARERALDRLVAIKVLPPEAADASGTRERFRREARTAAKLTHPNIVPLHTFGETEGMMYFVMGYVRGEPLADRMRREGRMPAVDVRRILAEVADALDYAHRQGVVHRDIKPDNVLLEDESGRALLTDFGVARTLVAGQTLTDAGTTVGTPHYMSPEQASGERNLDGRSDLYSLGVMGYAMLSGRMPFEGEGFRDILVQHVTREPAPLKTIEPSVPEDLAAAVMRCLAKDRAGRWPDGRSLRIAIERAGDDEDELPGVLGALDGGAAGVCLTFAGVGLFGFASYLFPGLRAEEGPWWVTPVLLAAAIACVVASVEEVARAKGARWREIVQVMLRAPRWWPVWYPRKWRRPGDVYDRLPVTVKRLRSTQAGAYAVAVAVAPVMLLSFYYMLHGPDFAVPLAIRVGALGGVVGMMGLFYGSGIGATVWGRRRGLNRPDSIRIAFAPTGKLALWRKPKYAAILLPPGADRPAGHPAEPQSPREYLRGVLEGARQLTGPARQIGTEAVAATRQLLTAIEAVEAEMTTLARDARPAEIGEIEGKLRALGAESPTDGEARRQMRQLLSSQLQLLRQLAVQLEAATDRRADLLDLLKTLWLQVANLRAHTAEQSVEIQEISGRIRALCDEIERHAAAMEEAARILPPRQSS